MAEWILGVSKAAALGWARGPGKRSERRSRPNAICPNAMRSFWKVAAFRLTESIRIQSGRRALRCFQNELHHFIILNLKWYNPDISPPSEWDIWQFEKRCEARQSKTRAGSVAGITPPRAPTRSDRPPSSLASELPTLRVIPRRSHARPH